MKFLFFHIKKSTQVLLWAYQQYLLKNICTESLQVAFYTFLATILMSLSAQFHFLPLWAGDAQHEQRLKAEINDWHHLPLWFWGTVQWELYPEAASPSQKAPHLWTVLKTQHLFRVTAALHHISHLPVRCRCSLRIITQYRSPAPPDSHISSFSLKSTSGLTP